MTSTRPRTAFRGAWALALAAGLPLVQAAELDALDLKPEAEPAAAPAARRAVRAFGEVAVGRLSQRYGLGSETARRASLDLNVDLKVGTGFRVVFSDRLDDIHPVESGERSTLNSVRELFGAWQSEDAGFGIDIGRVNYRNGPAYGFNPTDYFRDGSSRAVVTADPLALRENRLGTAMVRMQKLWPGGAVSVALAPKLANAPSRDSFSFDWGATNHSDRALVAVSLQARDGLSGQLFAFHERGKGAQIGAAGTALLGSSMVAFAEASHGRDTELLSEALDTQPRVVRATRAAAGLTYTTASRLSLTAEFEYNGFALNQDGWNRALAQWGLEPLGAYLTTVQRRQDIASRRAVMLYASQRDAWVKNLELTGLVRYNLEDRSRFAWAEARYHFERVDLALQWQANLGRDATEFGSNPGRSLVQLLAAVYF